MLDELCSASLQAASDSLQAASDAAAGDAQLQEIPSAPASLNSGPTSRSNPKPAPVIADGGGASKLIDTLFGSDDSESESDSGD